MSKVEHVAMIMDGNRRYARKHNLPLVEGHRKGAEKLQDVLKWCQKRGVKQLTLYTFSIQNFDRKKEEVDYLFSLFNEYFDQFINNEEIEKNKVRVRVLGRIHMFPEEIQKKIHELHRKTKDYDQYTLNFMMAYGSREELVDAVRNIAENVKFNDVDPKEITQEMITNELYLPDAPDILIRTGGEHRISNYLLWQISYTELFFVDPFWPEFSEADFDAVLTKFSERERRFGK